MKLEQEYLSVSATVRAALSERRPVVALESTIIAHGMPYPENVETALLVEKTIRAFGAVPATIAILNGQLKAGLDEEEIELIGRGHQYVSKASRRDIPFLLANGKPGATTVAATMIIAEMAGIRIFATGGIGGVHRGGGQSMDISADLPELARTGVAVVCAGAKSILDIGLTLEYLETHGVPVIGYQTDKFPAFYTRDSGHLVQYRLNSPAEVAGVLQAKWRSRLKGGAIIANPIPRDYEPSVEAIAKATEEALKEAEEKNIQGKQITPFLLERIKDLTDGKSLEANVQLVLNNAKLAAKIAKEM